MWSLDLISQKMAFWELDRAFISLFELALNLQVQIIPVFCLIVSIFCALKPDLADVHLPRDTCALSPGAQGPAALTEGRRGLVWWDQRIGLA